MTDILKGLNPEQKQAVVHDKGPLLIIAGAGTGKTTVITKRIAHLIETKKAKPGEILALTFTDKSADEMETRVDQLVPYGYIDVSISTFHAFGDRILRDYALDLGMRPDYRVLSTAEQAVFLREHIFELPLKHYLSLGDPVKHVDALLRVFSRAKDEDIDPEAWIKKAVDEKELEVAEVYKKYQELKYKNGFMDFGDQVNLTLKLFREHPEILKKFQKQYKYVLVDEFQDTNYAQFELLKLLVKKHKNITVVGDDDQCLPPDAVVTTQRGKEKIKHIKKGDFVLSAVGKGHLTFSRVNKVMKNKKHARFVTFTTESGKKITTTSNHKMFCFVPVKTNKSKTYYVYLMHRNDLGWRLGITNDLAQRLKLERSADRIVALRSFENEEEARYHEIMWSLKYGIPTVCFQEREGVAIKGELLKKLYADIPTEMKAQWLAHDLDIDLNSHHFCLGAVMRGGKTRIKIILEMCCRRYRSKHNLNSILKNPKVFHQVSLDSSEPTLPKILNKYKIPFSKSKKGIRVRITNQSLQQVGEIAERLKTITGGILEAKFSLGTTNKQHRPALVMPASNVQIGHFLPVVSGHKVVYERILKVESYFGKSNVYDLEVDRTHNFVADGVVVHNSIYKFRGAAISNILNFEKIFKKLKKVVLAKNYRSGQIILDSAYKLIQHNNPDRLEIKSKVNKKLVSSLSSLGLLEHKNFDSVYSEADWVAQKIKEKHESGKYKLSDFAILTRSNANAEAFRQSLNMVGLANMSYSGGGLYQLPEVRMAISFLRVIGDLADSVSLYDLACSELYSLEALDLQKLNTFASRRNITLHHVFTHLDGQSEGFKVLDDIKPKTRETIREIMQDIAEYINYAKDHSTGEVLYLFFKKTGYLKRLNEIKDLESDDKIKNLAQFFEKIREFHEVAEVDRVAEFVKYLNILRESGDDPASSQPDFDIDAVNILTVHRAKGLEFPVVFITCLVSDKFPTRKRKDPIELPDKLIKDILPKGEYHLQEERRLFYVAMTRAKSELYLTSSLDYGGKRVCKLSQFVLEALDKPMADVETIKRSPMGQIELFAPMPRNITKSKKKEGVLSLSFYHINDYLSCPLKYKYVHILRVPLLPNHQIIYGSALHKAAQAYLVSKKNNQKFTAKNLEEVFLNNWSSEGFISREHEERRLATGKKALANFYKREEKLGYIPFYVEESFTINQDDIRVRGRFDRVDKRDGKVFIIDFKSSDVRTEEDALKRAKSNLQLSIYALAWKHMFSKIPDRVELHFLDSGLIGSVEKKPKELDKTWEKVQKVAEGIRSENYKATPSSFVCQYCAYSEVCPESMA